MKDHRKDRWANSWTHREDALLMEVCEMVGSRHKKAWIKCCELGLTRSYDAFKNRQALLYGKQSQMQSEYYNLPKGWGVYV